MRTLYMALRRRSASELAVSSRLGWREDLLQVDDVRRRALGRIIRVEHEMLRKRLPPRRQPRVETLERPGELRGALARRPLRVDAAQDVAHGDGQAAHGGEGRDAVRGRARVVLRLRVVREGLPVLELLVRVQELDGDQGVGLL